MHKGHKVLEIDDEESFKNEKISIETSVDEFNSLNEKTISLKNKIEKEIEQINNLYDKIDKEVTQSFTEKYDKLKKEENDLKEKLQIETTKVKEKLELFLSECNEQIKNNEKMNKGIKTLKNNEKNHFKSLSYISKINKTKNTLKNLFQELMRNLKISFNKDKNTIEYEEYYFNGIQPPKDIEFKDIYSDSVNICWKIDDIKINDIDNKNIKFKVEMRKESGNKNFEQVYEGNNKSCLIENLKMKKNYEFRFCSSYNDLISCWSKLYKMQTTDVKLDSEIIKENEKKNEFLKKLHEWTEFKKLELLYRGTRDGGDGHNFHTKCDNQGPTILLCKNNKGNIFGGYASISWTKEGEWKSSPGNFIFTLTNIYNSEPTIFKLKDNNSNAVYHFPDFGPIIGLNDLYFYNNFLNVNNGNCKSFFPNAFIDSLGKGKSIFTGDNNNNNNYIKVVEIEVFKLFK